MIIQPTGALPGDFDSVNSEEIQNISVETLPANAVSRVGKFSIIFRLEGKPDVEWKYPSESARNTDLALIISLINTGLVPVPTPNLQAVTDVNANTTNSILINDSNSRTVLSSNAVSGLLLPSLAQTWGILNATGIGTFVQLINANGVVKPYKEYMYYLEVDASGGIVTETQGINDHGGTPVFANSGVGSYTMTLTGAFAGIMTHCDISIMINGVSTEAKAYIFRANDNIVQINIVDNSGAAIDGFIGTIHIKTVTP